MRVLIIKTSSMGDIIHTLPALTDAGRAIPGIRFDWVVEENFAQIPSWHPLVDKVIPIALRRWRKNKFSIKTLHEWREFYRRLHARQYDLVIDAQGLLKSAVLARLARGRRVGLNRHSVREPLAALFYQQTFSVEKKQHAIDRLRQLFNQALGYELPVAIPDYGIDRSRLAKQNTTKPYLVFLHATTWVTKHWPESYWVKLAAIANQNGYEVKFPWGSVEEQARARRIKNAVLESEGVSQFIEVLPKLDLIGMAKVLASAKAVVAVDTGLGHLAAALNVPAVSLYGPTNPVLTGAMGATQKHLTAKFPCSPCLSRNCTYRSVSELTPACFGTVTPEDVWRMLGALI